MNIDKLNSYAVYALRCGKVYCCQVPLRATYNGVFKYVTIFSGWSLAGCYLYIVKMYFVIMKAQNDNRSLG